jgi:hypothetical protein
MNFIPQDIEEYNFDIVIYLYFFYFIYFKFELKLYFFLDKFIYISQWLILKNNLCISA